MRRGRKPKPVITYESLQSALKLLSFRANDVPDTQPLAHLTLIDAFLDDAARPSAEDLRIWALKHILTEKIQNRYNQLLDIFALPVVDSNTPKNRIDQHITTVFQQQSDVLSGWCVLFCRYLRPEISYTSQDFAELGAIHPRSIRRYQQAALLELRDQLIADEWTTQQAIHTTRLKSMLPPHPNYLQGRAHEQHQIQQHITHHSMPIIITGADGIGKTALAATIVRNMIDHEQVDYLVWMDKPTSVNDITNQLWNTIAPHGTGNWKNYLLTANLVVVIDDCEHVLEHDDWQNFYEAMQGHTLICTHTSMPVSSEHYLTVHLSDLAYDEACDLIDTYTASENADKQSVYKDIFERVGGNPSALQRMIQLYESQGILSADISLRAIFDKRFQTLTETLQYGWLLLAIESYSMPLTMLDRLHVNSESLIHNGIALRQDTQITLRSTAHKRYIQGRYNTDIAFKRGANIWLQQSLLRYVENVDLIGNEMTVILHVIGCEWLAISTDAHCRLLRKMPVKTMSASALRVWRTQVETYLDFESMIEQDNLDLHLQYIIALQRLRDPQMPYYTNIVMSQAGATGDFATLMVARYYLALHHQARGEYQKAIDMYTHLISLFPHYPEPQLESAVHMQLAHIAIMREDLEEARKHLNDNVLAHDAKTTEQNILKCELLLLTQQFTRCINLIQSYLKQTQPSRFRASLHTIAGRAYQQQQQYDTMLAHFDEALMLSERYGDIFDISRARTNLASAYLAQNRLSTQDTTWLETLLNETLRWQRDLQDVVGYEATRQTLRILRAYMRHES